MLSGNRAFHRDSTVETMSAILKEEPPDLAAHRADILPALDRIVRRCLEKQVDRRFRSASDLGFALETLSAPSATGNRVDPTPAEARPSRFPRRARVAGACSARGGSACCRSIEPQTKRAAIPGLER